jgi:hypothetical protein
MKYELVPQMEILYHFLGICLFVNTLGGQASPEPLNNPIKIHKNIFLEMKK